jgi:hypothetical protein
MITDAIYYVNNNKYTNDKILTFTPKKMYHSKKIIMIIHDDKHYVEKYIHIPEYNISKIYYTSNITKSYYTFQATELKSTYDLSNLQEFINNVCTDELVLYTILFVGNEHVNKFNIIIERKNIRLLDYNILDLEINEMFNNEITIINSNINNIIGMKFNIMPIIHIFSLGSIGFNNFLIYKYAGFDIYEKVFFTYNKNINIKSQITAIISDVHLKSRMNNEELFKYEKIISHSANYLKHYENNQSYAYELKHQISIIKEQQLSNSLSNSDSSELLFQKCLQHNNSQSMKMKMHKTYITNIHKIRNRNIRDNDIEASTNKINESLDFYTSTVSLNTWSDELEEQSCLGILLNIQCTKLSKMGIVSNNIFVNNFTNSLVSANQIIAGQNIFLNTYNCLDNGKYTRNILSGPGIGKGNATLPIYINEKHWYNAKLFIEECVSLAICQNSFSFKPLMIDVYFQVLIHMIDHIVLSSYTQKDFYTFINFYITTKEIIKLYNIDYTIYQYFMSQMKITDQLSEECRNINKILVFYMLYHETAINKTFFVHIYEENIRRTIGRMKLKDLLLFKNYSDNKLAIEQQIDNQLVNNVYTICQLKPILNLIVSDFYINNGIIDANLIDTFKYELNRCTEFEYSVQICQMTSIKDHEIINDHLILQSFITRNNKKRQRAFDNNKYIDILLSEEELIDANNNKIIEIIQ